MIAISVRFIAGGYHATPWGRHVNEGAVEWPPSSWRLLRALIASWKQTMPGVPEERMKRLLTSLSTPPDFRLPKGTPTHTRHYMPTGVGDSRRTLVIDSFVAVQENDPVEFLWDGDLPNEDRELLARLLENMPYFGRAESWCKAGLVEASEPNCRWLRPGESVPDDCDSVRVLVPKPDVTLNQLMVDTADLRDRQKLLDPPGSQWVLYAVKRSALLPVQSSYMRPHRASAEIVAARYALDAVPLPPITATASLAEVVRKAVMSQYGRHNQGAISPILAGRMDRMGPLKGNKHAYYLPTDEDFDGRLDHVTVWAPGGLGAKECEALASTRALNLGKDIILNMLLLGFGTEEGFGMGPCFRASTVWQSATPFVLSRHPKRYRSGGTKLNADGTQVDGPEDQIRREWQIRRKDNASLPEIVSIEAIPRLRIRERHLSWLEFRTARSSPFAPPPVAVGGGFRIRFSTPTRGPIALGYGAHYGLGLFVPGS
ncbi:MAG: type I-G CRISPR-associated protein Csb2 [Bacillota bacterium]|jgi:CRISPR-associated protein Csb2